MLYKAVVIDNSMLFERGTIRVRIAGYYYRKIVWNLAERFPESIEEGDREDSQFSNDFDAILATSMGGGRNYGVLNIPQPNEKGLVGFLGGKETSPIWLGGIFQPQRDENFEIDYVNFPSDDFSDGGRKDGIVRDNLRIGNEIESANEKSFVIRTKHTTTESQEDIDFEHQETSNIFTVGKRRVRLTHFPEGSWVEDEDAEQDEPDDEDEDLVEAKKPKKFTDVLFGKDDYGDDVIKLNKKDYKNELYNLFEMKDDVSFIEMRKEDEEEPVRTRQFLMGNEKHDAKKDEEDNGEEPEIKDTIFLKSDDFENEIYSKFEMKDDASYIEIRKEEDEEPVKTRKFFMGNKNYEDEDADEEETILLKSDDFENEIFSKFEIEKDVARLFVKQKDGDDVKIERNFTLGVDEDGNDVIRLINKNYDDEDFVEFELTKDHGILSLTKEGDEIARFSMEDEAIQIFNKEGENKIIFDDDGMQMFNKEGENKIVFDDDGVRVFNKEGANKISFKDDDEIEIENDAGSKITMDSSGVIKLSADSEVHIMGDGHVAVRLEHILNIIEAFEDHVHITYGGGPSSPPMDGPGAPPIDTLLISDKQNLGSDNVKVE